MTAIPPKDDIRKLLANLLTNKEKNVLHDALKFLVYTLLRPCELITLKWTQVNLGNHYFQKSPGRKRDKDFINRVDTLTIPQKINKKAWVGEKRRFKRKQWPSQRKRLRVKERLVKLPKQAIEILNSQTHCSKYVFPDVRPDQPLTYYSLSKALKGLNFEGSVYEFRTAVEYVFCEIFQRVIDCPGCAKSSPNDCINCIPGIKERRKEVNSVIELGEVTVRRRAYGYIDKKIYRIRHYEDQAGGGIGGYLMEWSCALNDFLKDYYHTDVSNNKA